MPTYYPINETLARQANMMNSAAKQVTEAWMPAESAEAVVEELETGAPAPSSWSQQMM